MGERSDLSRLRRSSATLCQTPGLEAAQQCNQRKYKQTWLYTRVRLSVWRVSQMPPKPLLVVSFNSVSLSSQDGQLPVRYLAIEEQCSSCGSLFRFLVISQGFHSRGESGRSGIASRVSAPAFALLVYGDRPDWRTYIHPTYGFLGCHR